jgi:tight adherence protein C
VLAPYFEGGNELDARMKSAALERDEIRARERARLAMPSNRAEPAPKSAGLRGREQRVGARHCRTAEPEGRRWPMRATVAKLRAAGYRTQNALNMFLLARFVLPFVFLVAAVVYVFVLDNLVDKPFTVRVLACIVAAYIGFYTPNMFVSNQAKKRRPRSRLHGRMHST